MRNLRKLSSLNPYEGLVQTQCGRLLNRQCLAQKIEAAAQQFKRVQSTPPCIHLQNSNTFRNWWRFYTNGQKPVSFVELQRRKLANRGFFDRIKNPNAAKFLQIFTTTQSQNHSNLYDQMYTEFVSCFTCPQPYVSPFNKIKRTILPKTARFKIKETPTKRKAIATIKPSLQHPSEQNNKTARNRTIRFKGVRNIKQSPMLSTETAPNISKDDVAEAMSGELEDKMAKELQSDEQFLNDEIQKNVRLSDHIRRKQHKPQISRSLPDLNAIDFARKPYIVRINRKIKKKEKILPKLFSSRMSSAHFSEFPQNRTAKHYNRTKNKEQDNSSGLSTSEMSIGRIQDKKLKQLRKLEGYKWSKSPTPWDQRSISSQMSHGKQSVSSRQSKVASPVMENGQVNQRSQRPSVLKDDNTSIMSRQSMIKTLTHQPSKRNVMALEEESNDSSSVVQRPINKYTSSMFSKLALVYCQPSHELVDMSMHKFLPIDIEQHIKEFMLKNKITFEMYPPLPKNWPRSNNSSIIHRMRNERLQSLLLSKTKSKNSVKPKKSVKKKRKRLLKQPKSKPELSRVPSCEICRKFYNTEPDQPYMIEMRKRQAREELRTYYRNRFMTGSRSQPEGRSCRLKETESLQNSMDQLNSVPSNKLKQTQSLQQPPIRLSSPFIKQISKHKLTQSMRQKLIDCYEMLCDCQTILDNKLNELQLNEHCL